MARQPEGKPVKAIMNYLNTLPSGFFFKVHGGLFQRVGIPDIVGCLKGRFIAIEVKQPGKEPSSIQSHIIALIEEAKGIVGVAHTVEEAEKIISPLLLTKKKGSGKIKTNLKKGDPTNG